MTLRSMTCAVLFIGLCLPNESVAQAGLVKMGVKQILTSLTRDDETATQLTLLGGEDGVEALLVAAEESGGEALVRRVVHYGRVEGPSLLRFIRGDPNETVRALDSIPGEFLPGAIRAAEREPELMATLVVRHGRSALDAVRLHPGVGVVLVDALGIEGIELCRELSTDEAVRLSRHLSTIVALDAKTRNEFMALLLHRPARVIDFLRDNPEAVSDGDGLRDLEALVMSRAGSSRGSHESRLGWESLALAVAGVGLMLSGVRVLVGAKGGRGHDSA